MLASHLWEKLSAGEILVVTAMLAWVVVWSLAFAVANRSAARKSLHALNGERARVDGLTAALTARDAELASALAERDVVSAQLGESAAALATAQSALGEITKHRDDARASLEALVSAPLAREVLIEPVVMVDDKIERVGDVACVSFHIRVLNMAAYQIELEHIDVRWHLGLRPGHFVVGQGQDWEAMTAAPARTVLAHQPDCYVAIQAKTAWPSETDPMQWPAGAQVVIRGKATIRGSAGHPQLAIPYAATIWLPVFRVRPSGDFVRDVAKAMSGSSEHEPPARALLKFFGRGGTS